MPTTTKQNNNHIRSFLLLNMDNSVYKQQETIMKNNALKGCNASANGGNDNHKQNTVTNNSV